MDFGLWALSFFFPPRVLAGLWSEGLFARGRRGYLGRVESSTFQLIQFVCSLPWLKHAVFVGQSVSYLATHGTRRTVNHNTWDKTITNFQTRDGNFKGEHTVLGSIVYSIVVDLACT
jgi:hypothetical protein